MHYNYKLDEQTTINIIKRHFNLSKKQKTN